MSQSPPQPIKIGTLFDAVYPAYALMAGLQLDVFSAMKDGAKSPEEIASALDVNVEKISVLLHALVAADLLRVEDGKFSNTDETAFYLVNSSPGYFGDIHNVLSIMWDAITTTAETIRTNKPQAHVDYHEEEHDVATPAFAGMHKLSLMSSRDLLKHCDLSRHKNIADIGGGSGGLSIALTHEFPEMHSTILDLKAAIDLAEGYVSQVAQKDRIHLKVHNIVADSLDMQFDGAVMRAFTQVISPEENQSAFKHTFDALEPGGCLYIIAQIVDDSRVSPRDTALLNLVFLNTYEGGRAFTEAEYRKWLSEAGFTNIERFVQRRGDSIIRAVKAE